MNDDSLEPFHGWKDCEVEHAIEMQKLLYKITGFSDGITRQNTQKVTINVIYLLEYSRILSCMNVVKMY